MKMSVKWHEGCLENMGCSIERDTKNFEEIHTKLLRDKNAYEFYQEQILTAKKKNKEEFDREKFMVAKKKKAQ